MTKSQNHPMPKEAQQLLPPEAYTSQEWLAREVRDLFSRSWAFAGVTTDFQETGDYVAIRAGRVPLAVIMGPDGELRAFHNICRHRGTEMLDIGRGNAGKTLTCPYHRWTYGLDGAMRGAPDKASCFPDLDMSSISLHEASIGIFQDLVFVHPDAQPAEAFEDWASDLPAWPHNLTDGTLVESPYTLTYEMNCNWKVFYENAIDGYHLAYLHENTLGRATPDKNIWEAHGRHVVWYSTETGAKSPTTEFVREQMDAVGVPLLKSASGANFPGVYMMFPLTIITPSTTGFLVSVLEPLGPDKTLLHVRLWAMPERNGQALRNFDISDQMPGLDPVDGRIKLALLKEHPLKLAKRSGDFQIEDVWICEKMQRGLSSPRYSVGGLANGPGAEAPLTHFQQNLLDFVPLRP